MTKTGPMRRLLDRLESSFDAVFTPRHNPLNQLGALGWFFYWIVLVTGIYLYIFFDTGLSDAYESLERITHAQWYAGGVMRSLHRYASDALVLIVVVHILREWILGRFRGARWFAWVSGVPLLWFIYASGISGYWMVWDQLAQYIAIATTEWLDALPFFGEPIARNFLRDGTLSGRFFTLMVFIHIGVPLFLLFLMWVHIQRHMRPRVNPPRALAVGTLMVLVLLSLFKPALSQAPADLGTVPAIIGFDWFYLLAYPLLERISGLALWGVLVFGSIFMLCLPWLGHTRRQPAAVVDLDNCNGCGRCVQDCPFSALTLEPRQDGLPFSHQVEVKAALCMSCGICAGACPTATPFRRNREMTPGIDMPHRPLRDVLKQSVTAAAALQGNERVLVYACEAGPELSGSEASDGFAVVRLPCVAMLPPPFMDYLLNRGHVDGIFLAGCREGDCHFRLGLDWTEQRIARERDPFLRRRVARERIARAWIGCAHGTRLNAQLADFRAGLPHETGDELTARSADGPVTRGAEHV